MKVREKIKELINLATVVEVIVGLSWIAAAVLFLEDINFLLAMIAAAFIVPRISPFIRYMQRTENLDETVAGQTSRDVQSEAGDRVVEAARNAGKGALIGWALLILFINGAIYGVIYMMMLIQKLS